MSFLFFLLSAFILILEGFLLIRLIAPNESKLIQWSLGYPIALLPNALILFLLSLVGIPLTRMSVLIVHVLFLMILGVLAWKFRRMPTSAFDNEQRAIPLRLILVLICSLFLLTTLFTSFVHIFLLPTFSWDTFTNWTMRSWVFLEQGTVLVPETAKSQYPILFHATQMLPMFFTGLREWIAHGMTFLLSLTSFTALFFLIRRSKGMLTALLTVTLLTSIPIVSIHLEQGYADIHMISYLLLSAILLQDWFESRNHSTLILSAFLVVASSWTKLEGLYFGVVPWAVFVLFDFLRSRPKTSEWVPIALILSLAFLWPLYTLTQGMLLSPHGGSLEYYPEALRLIGIFLFLRGSFGVHAIAIVIAGLFLLIHRRQLLSPYGLSGNIQLLWGTFALLGMLGIYLFTKEFQGLANQEGFLRSMMLPVMLLTQGLVIRCGRILETTT